MKFCILSDYPKLVKLLLANFLKKLTLGINGTFGLKAVKLELTGSAERIFLKRRSLLECVCVCVCVCVYLCVLVCTCVFYMFYCFPLEG